MKKHFSSMTRIFDDVAHRNAPESAD